MIEDVITSGVLPCDIASWRVETRLPHRVRARNFLLDFLPDRSVGAELGVFTGLFSATLARQAKLAKITFVDPWWLAYGEYFPSSWGSYTDYGRLSTKTAHALAVKRVEKSGLSNRHVEAAFSVEWLESQPDHSLDWVYLDSTHTYEDTLKELELLDRKVKPDGMITGDDWYWDKTHVHYGVTRAVNEFVKISNFDMAVAGYQGQWVLRRSPRRSLS